MTHAVFEIIDSIKNYIFQLQEYLLHAQILKISITASRMPSLPSIQDLEDIIFDFYS